VPITCGFQGLIGRTSAGVQFFVVGKIGCQIGFGCSVFVANSWIGMRYNGGDVGLFKNKKNTFLNQTFYYIFF